MDDGATAEIPDDPRIVPLRPTWSARDRADRLRRPGHATSGRPPRSATRPAPPATRRACCTRTARPGCTRSRRSRRGGVRAARSSTDPAGRADVPRERLGAAVRRRSWPARRWSCPGRTCRRRRCWSCWSPRQVTVTARRADDLDGHGPAARRARPVRPAHDHLRRLGRAEGAVRGVARAKIGLPITQAWGMTEMSPLGSVCTMRSEFADLDEDEKADIRATAGIAPPGVEMRIVDAETRRGAAVGRRGHRRAGVPRAVDRQAVLPHRRAGRAVLARTAGCVPATSARSSPLGYLRLVDRTKDLVKSGGEWISSVDLENEIMAHPKVAEAAVIAVPHPKWSRASARLRRRQGRRGAHPGGGAGLPA